MKKATPRETEKSAEEENAEEKKREEIERAARESERLKIQHEQEIEEARNEVIEALTPDVSGHEDTYVYTIKLTEDAKEKLDMYLTSVGIDFDSMIQF